MKKIKIMEAIEKDSSNFTRIDYEAEYKKLKRLLFR